MGIIHTAKRDVVKELKRKMKSIMEDDKQAELNKEDLIEVRTMLRLTISIGIESKY